MAEPPLGRSTSGEAAVRGLAIALTGFVIITLADVAVKFALPTIGVVGALLWRGFAGAAAVALMSRGRYLRPRNLRLILLRSSLHCASAIIWYIVWLRGYGLADSYAVAAAAPLLMTLLAIPLLGEQVGWRRWTSTLVGFGGVLVMLQPGGALWRWEVGVMLVAVALMALTRLWTRVLGRTDTPATITFWLMVAHIPVGLLLLPLFPPPVSLFPSGGTMLVLAALGCGNALAHMLFARAFAIAPVSVLAPFEYSPLIWSLPIGLMIWGDWPAPSTFAGAGIVIAAGLYNLHRERLRARQSRLGGGR